MDENYYIYLHIKKTDGTPFYIGKGKNNRSKSKHGRNKFWHNIVNKYDYDIIYLEKNLTNDKANIKEIYWINKIGRRDLCKGPLVNLTDGGFGSAGYKVSDETRLKISESNIGRISWNSGIKTGPEKLTTKVKKSESKKYGNHPRCKLVLDHSNGIYYLTVKEASVSLGYNYSTLKSWLQNKRKNKSNLKYV